MSSASGWSAVSFDPRVVANTCATLGSAVRAAGFWLAVLLPVVLLGLLVGGVAGHSPTVFGSLLALDGVGLVLGKDYQP